MRDYLSILALCGKDPFTSPLDTLLFVEDVDQIRSAGFSIAELDYLLRHTERAVTEIAPSVSTITIVLGAIRAGLQTLAVENTYRDDPADPRGSTLDLNGDLTRTKLALLDWDSALIDPAIATFNDAVTYRAPLAALPGDLVLPDGLSISYDSAGGTVLEFTGAMTEEQRAALSAASFDIEYGNAVQALFDAPRRFVRRNLRTFSMPNFAQALATLPGSVVFPAALKDKVYLDATAGLLHFRGAMTETERDALLALSTDPADAQHVAYLDAVDALFAAPDALVPEPDDAFLTAGSPDSDAAALFDLPTTPAARFERALRKLLPHLRTILSRRLVIQHMSEALQLEMGMTEQLLTAWVNWPAHAPQKAMEAFLAPAFAESDQQVPIDDTRLAEQFAAYLLLHKIARVISTLDFTRRQLRWLFEYGPVAGWPDLNQLPLAFSELPDAALPAWERLWRLSRLRDSLPRGEDVLDSLFALTHGLPPGATDDHKDAAKAGVIDLLVTALGWTEGDLQTLVGNKQDHAQQGCLNAAFPDDFRNECLLRRLQTCFSLLRRLGMSAEQCGRLSEADVTATVASDIRQAVRAKYDEAQWLKVAQPLRDALREKQRAALVAYLVAHPDGDHPWRDTDDVYAYFLIDVEMSPCQMTSRIKQAISSVQLFVQRCLMNLEPDVLAAAEVDEKWREWKWMKNYRVWEANRKVFLYPENWIEPELRDDKSPFFKTLESELSQSDLTAETAEEAFLAVPGEAGRGGPPGDRGHGPPGREGYGRPTGRRHPARLWPHHRRDACLLLPAAARRILDRLGARGPGHRGRPPHPGALEPPAVPVLAYLHRQGRTDDRDL